MPQQDENEKKRKNSKTKTGSIVAVVLVVIVIGMVLAAFALGSANLRWYEFCQNWSYRIDADQTALKANIWATKSEYALLNQEINDYDRGFTESRP